MNLLKFVCLLLPLCARRERPLEMEFFSVNGQLLVNGQRFHLKGANWFGYEGDIRILHGLWSYKLEKFLDFLANNGFNAIRVPFAAEFAFGLDTLKPDAKAVNFHENRRIEGMTVGQSMDFLVSEAAKRGLLIMFDMHCLTAKAGITDLWHLDKAFPEERLHHAWSIMVKRYINSWNVFAVDLKNEPHDSATWGDNSMRTDWRLAAERLGNALLAINPRLLIFVEGTSGVQIPITTPEAAFWGGSLASARQTPVRLSNPAKLVYSPHVYGPGVYMQEYFKSPEFPANMPGIWTRQWGHLMHHPRAGPAVIVGEWGGFFKEGTIERRWAEAFVDYLLSIGATDQFYWCMNPNSGDTGGLLADDWITPETYKLHLIHRLCPDPSKIEVNSHGQPINVAFGGCGTPPPQICPVEQIQPPPQAPAQQQAEQTGEHNGQCQLGQVIEVDTSALPELEGTASIIKEWPSDVNPAFGKQYQVEASFKNNKVIQLRDIIVEAIPAGQCQQLWNLTAIEGGQFWSLPNFCTDYGGMQPHQQFGWGGIFTAERLRFVVRPANTFS